MFSLRIFTINYYLSKPEQNLDQTYSDFKSNEIKQVPIIRIFGTTPEGTCFLQTLKEFNQFLAKTQFNPIQKVLTFFLSLFSKKFCETIFLTFVTNYCTNIKKNALRLVQLAQLTQDAKFNLFRYCIISKKM